MLRAELKRAEQDEDQHRDDESRQDVHHDHLPPREQRKQRADHHRRNRVADVAAHAVQRKNQAFALRVALAERRDRRRMPDAVAKADQRDAREQHRVAVGKADEKVREADPEQRYRHQQALAAHGVDQHSARHIGNGRGNVLAGHDQPDLAVRQTELAADQRQQQVEGRRIPVRQAMADGNQPHIAKCMSRRGLRRGNTGQAGSLLSTFLRYRPTSSADRVTAGSYSGASSSCSRSFSPQAL